jgi:ABC-type glutathione transport system ATPase component
MNFARRISDQVIYFEGGHAVEAGSPQEVFKNPQQEATRAFMKSFEEEEAPLPQTGNEDPKLDTARGTRGNQGQEE